MGVTSDLLRDRAAQPAVNPLTAVGRQHDEIGSMTEEKFEQARRGISMPDFNLGHLDAEPRLKLGSRGVLAQQSPAGECLPDVGKRCPIVLAALLGHVQQSEPAVRVERQAQGVSEGLSASGRKICWVSNGLDHAEFLPRREVRRIEMAPALLAPSEWLKLEVAIARRKPKPLMLSSVDAGQTKAARALLNMREAGLARIATVHVATIRLLEGATEIRGVAEAVWKIQRAPEEAGIEFIPAEAGRGPGVRLRDVPPSKGKRKR